MEQKAHYSRYNGHLWDGYIWKSDSAEPKVLNAEEFDFSEIDDNSNPFVIEGELYDSSNRLSLSIKYIDGKHIIKEFSPAEIGQNVQTTQISLMPNRMPEISELHFWQIWRAEDDEFCKDASGKSMKVLRPAELVFMGFKLKEDKK